LIKKRKKGGKEKKEGGRKRAERRYCPGLTSRTALTSIIPLSKRRIKRKEKKKRKRKRTEKATHILDRACPAHRASLMSFLIPLRKGKRKGKKKNGGGGEGGLLKRKGGRRGGGPV